MVVGWFLVLVRCWRGCLRRHAGCRGCWCCRRRLRWFRVFPLVRVLWRSVWVLVAVQVWVSQFLVLGLGVVGWVLLGVGARYSWHNTPTKCDTFAAFLPSLGRRNFLELGVRGHRDLGYSIIVPLSVYGQKRVCLNPQMHIFAIGAIFLLCRFSACLPLCQEKTKTLEKCGSMGAHLPTAALCARSTGGT